MPQFLGGKDCATRRSSSPWTTASSRPCASSGNGLNQRAPVEFRGARFSPSSSSPRVCRSPPVRGKIHGAVCVGALCEGTLAGRPARRFMYQTTSHDEAWERLGVQGTAWQTGASAACAVRLFARGEVARRGVRPPGTA